MKKTRSAKMKPPAAESIARMADEGRGCVAFFHEQRTNGTASTTRECGLHGSDARGVGPSG